MAETDKKVSEVKIKIDDKEYLYDSLPENAKQVLKGLRAADA